SPRQTWHRCSTPTRRSRLPAATDLPDRSTQTESLRSDTTAESGDEPSCSWDRTGEACAIARRCSAPRGQPQALCVLESACDQDDRREYALRESAPESV